MNRSWIAAATVSLATLPAAEGCTKDPPPPERIAPPPAASAAPVATGTTRFTVVETGEATFLIDAPLEKIKGRFSKLRGALDVDVGDLKKTRGQIDLDLDDLKTATFSDPDKNATQTQHAHNWMEIGSDVEPKRREENRWARFTIDAIDDLAPAKLADAPETDGKRKLTVTAKGSVWLHGVTAPKTVKLKVTFTGPADAPTALHVETVDPLALSLKQHDVKPRDIAGKFLDGALEKVGKKIDDRVQVRLSIDAKR